jgi:hypothetical protein
MKVVIPFHKNVLSEDEMTSLATIRSCFDTSVICFIAPSSLDLAGTLKTGESVERFRDVFFKDIAGYNHLLTSSAFYERFSSSSHILICQLDCLVFRNELEFWAGKGFDYIAAPWFQRYLETPESGLWRVGNGGFSLRNVQSHLRVLNKRIPRGFFYPKHGSEPWVVTTPKSELGMYEAMVPWYIQHNPFTKWVTIEEELRRFPRNEDLFWSLEAPKFDASFRIATAEEALPFAFEMAPRWCFEKNGNKLPFACHAWARYDRDFWASVLKENGFLDRMTG